MPWSCTEPYVKGTDDIKQRIRSCTKSDAGAYADRQPCIEDCFLRDAPPPPPPAAAAAPPPPAAAPRASPRKPRAGRAKSKPKGRATSKPKAAAGRRTSKSKASPRPRCPAGSRRSPPRTGTCKPAPARGGGASRRPRCPNGSRRDRATGTCRPTK